MKHILMTGGHAATTALATIQELKKRGDVEISWIGAKQAVEGKKVLSLEFKEFSKIGVKCYPIFTGRVQKKFTKHTINSLLKIPFGFIHGLYLIVRLNPDVVLSFGGFAGFPIVFAAWLMQVPIVIHEQTAAVGLSNKWSSVFADKIAVSRRRSKSFFNSRKVVITGNPISESILKIRPRKRISNKKVLYITGGSRGSQILNEAVSPVLSELLKKYNIVHQTGELDYRFFKKVRSELPSKLKSKYSVFDNKSPLEIDKIFKKADIVVSRAGANTVSEIVLTGRPSILIPIPWSRYDEQAQNAVLAEKCGISVVLHQEELTGDRLLSEIENVRKSWSEMVKENTQCSKNFIDREASRNLSDLVCEISEIEK